MLNLDLMERLYNAKAFDRLLHAVVNNGLETPLPLRVRLSNAPAGAVAIALRRAVQLDYGRSDLTDRMARFLLAAQADDGSFDSDPLITAAAAAAWGRLLADRHADPDPHVAHAREAALVALAAMQDDDGLFQAAADRTEQDRALTAAFVLFLLAGDDTFRQTVRIADLCRWFEQRHDRLDRDTERLWRMSRKAPKRTRRRRAALAA